MEKRYFYTDPLAAAWMAKHHGVTFQISGVNSPVKYDHLDWGNLIEDFAASPMAIYIHPDSLHLLEPKVGDAVEFDRWHWERQRREETKDYPYQAHYASVVAYGRNDEYLGISSLGHGWDNTQQGQGFALPFKIIQRNGIPFMWPDNGEKNGE